MISGQCFIGTLPIKQYCDALLFCFFKPRALAAITVALLAGYWALLTFVPIRDFQLHKPAFVKHHFGA